MTKEVSDPMSLTDVGIGPTGLKRLENLGFTTTMDIICMHPKWLADSSGLKREPAEKAFQVAKDKLIKAGMLSAQQITASELLEKRKTIKRLRTGNKEVDAWLETGFESGGLSEIHGSSGAGKTQWCNVLAVQALRPTKDGGLDDEGNGLVLFLDTENTARPERMSTFIKARDMKSSILDRIIFMPITNYGQQITVLRNLAPQIREMKNVKLIIIDSAVEHFRRELTGPAGAHIKNPLLNEMVHILRNIAETHNIVVIMTNQIYNAMDQYSEHIQTYGGNIVGHAPSLRIRMEKLPKNRKATIYKSPTMPQKEFVYTITDNGIEEKKKNG